jgi:hypothetical protein
MGSSIRIQEAHVPAGAFGLLDTSAGKCKIPLSIRFPFCRYNKSIKQWLSRNIKRLAYHII